jgi:hypothetical protein
MQVWMFEFTKATTFGKGIEICTAFFHDNPECLIRLYKEAFATMLQIAYQEIGNDNKALEYARLCLQLTEVGDRGLIISNKVALAGLQRKPLKASGSPKDIEERIVYLEALFDEASGRGNGKRIVEPQILVQLAGFLADLWITQSDQSSIQETKRVQCLQNSMSWINSGQNMLPDVQDDHKISSRASLNLIQAEALQRMGRVDKTINMCNSLLFSQGDHLERQDRANIQYLLAITLSGKFLKDLTTDDIEKAKDMCLQAMKTATDLGNDFMAVRYLKALVSMCCIWRRSTVEIPFTTSEVLSWISKWEEIWEEIRSEASVCRGLQGLQIRQRIREKNSAGLYLAAIGLCIEEDNIIEAWKWVQKAKARAVVDSLGLSRAVPWHLSQGLSDQSRRLLEREQTLLDEIDTASEGWRYHLRREHLELCREMSIRSDLRAIQAIRQGGYLEVDELESMFRGEKNIVCVDWVELEGGTYHIITVRPGEAPRYFATNVSTEDVRLWLNCYVFGDESVKNLEGAVPEELESLEGLV